ncbi:MAG: glucosamine-6-phosphate deaminase [Chloroflexi bacterium]|nr:glucosamine-6-phosphate deaminase [Chloroflexota bacterium]
MNPKSIYDTRYGDLPVAVYATNAELGRAAADEAVGIIRRAVIERGEANIIIATGNSQLTFLAALREKPEIPWAAVNVFHMDEYVGIDPAHPASFPLFLRRHLLDYVTPKAFYPVPGQASDPSTDSELALNAVKGQAVAAACRKYEALLRSHPADLCALGIGENGHLAFNDPPFADFDDPVWAKVVKLDERSRRQQVGEGHFKSLAEVPTHAITLTIPALLAAKRVLAIVPEARKAEAVAAALLGPITEDCPASILRQTAHAHLFLDAESAASLPSR